MAQGTKLRWLIYIIVAFITFFILYALQPKPDYAAVGLVLPSQQTNKDKNVKSVVVMSPSQQQMADTGTYLGTVHVEQFGEVPLKQAKNDLLKKAALLAGSVGANQIYLQTLGRTPDSVPAPLSNYFLSATAVYQQNNLGQ